MLSFADEIAPEHLEIMRKIRAVYRPGAKRRLSLFGRLRAGAIGRLLGRAQSCAAYRRQRAVFLGFAWTAL